MRVRSKEGLWTHDEIFLKYTVKGTRLKGEKMDRKVFEMLEMYNKANDNKMMPKLEA